MINNVFYKSILIASFIALEAWAISPGSSPSTTTRRPPTRLRVCSDGGRVQVPVPDAVRRALMSHDSTFCRLGDNQFNAQISTWYQRSARQAPQTVVHDFNNDGKMDYAVLGQSQGDRVVINVALSGENETFTIQTLPVDRLGTMAWMCRDGQVNWCRNMGRDPLVITQFPYYLVMTENGLNLKYESTGAQELVYNLNRTEGRLEPAPDPRRFRSFQSPNDTSP